MSCLLRTFNRRGGSRTTPTDDRDALFTLFNLTFFDLNNETKIQRALNQYPE